MQSPLSEPTVLDWAKHRIAITRLWWDEDRTLAAVRGIMLREHAFKATPRQYRHRLQEWKLEKNFKEPELAALARHAEMIGATDPNQPIGHVRGRGVTLRRLRIAAQRKNLSLHELAVMAPLDFPESVRLVPVAAKPAMIADPDCYRVPEHTLGKLTAYIARSMGARTWLIVREDERSFVFIHRRHSRHVNLAGFRAYFLLGLTQIAGGQTVEGFGLMHIASDYLRVLVGQRCPLMVQEVLLAASRAINHSLPDLAECMLRLLVRASQQSYDRQLREMFVRLHALDATLFRAFTYQACLVCMRCLDDHADAKVSSGQGPASAQTLLSHLCSSINSDRPTFATGEVVRITFPQ